MDFQKLIKEAKNLAQELVKDSSKEKAFKAKMTEIQKVVDGTEIKEGDKKEFDSIVASVKQLQEDLISLPDETVKDQLNENLDLLAVAIEDNPVSAETGKLKQGATIKTGEKGSESKSEKTDSKTEKPEKTEKPTKTGKSEKSSSKEKAPRSKAIRTDSPESAENKKKWTSVKPMVMDLLQEVDKNGEGKYSCKEIADRLVAHFENCRTSPGSVNWYINAVNKKKDGYADYKLPEKRPKNQ